MKFNQLVLMGNVLDLTGIPVTGYENSNQPLTVKAAFRMALNGTYIDEQPGGRAEQTFENRMYRVELIKKLLAPVLEDVELAIEDVAEIIKCVKKNFLIPEVAYFLINVLEGK